MDNKVVDQVIAGIEQHFGKMTVTRGTHHEYVCLEIDFPGDGTVK